MSENGQRVLDGLHEVAELSRKAEDVAALIARGREDGAGDTLTAYRILDALGIARIVFAPNPMSLVQPD